MIDPQIALGVTTPKFDNPLDQYGKAASVRNAMQQGQIGQQQIQEGALGLQQKQIEMDQAAKLRDVLQNSPDLDTALPAVMKINPTVGIGLQKSILEGKKAQLDLTAKKAERFGSIAGTITDENSLHTGIMQAVGEGLIDKDSAAQLLQGGWTPEAQQTIKQVQQQALSAKEQHDAAIADIDAKIRQAGEARAAAKAPAELTSAQNAATASEYAPTKAAADAGKSVLEQKELQRQFDLTKNAKPEDYMAMVDQIAPPGVKENAELNRRTKSQVAFAIGHGDRKGAEDILKQAAGEVRQLEVATDPRVQAGKISVAVGTQEAKSNAMGVTEDDYRREGEKYARTGIMPPMGMQANGRGKIIHYANEYARNSGLSPRDIAAGQAAFQGDKSSLAKFQTQRDQIVSFENTASKNLDLFIDAASKIPDSGSPWINIPMRELDAKAIGSANMAAVNAARQVANNEIAKVTSGGGLSGILSDSARKEVQGYNPTNATFAQTKAVAAILRKDMANRHQSMDQMLGEIQDRMGGGGAVRNISGSSPASVNNDPLGIRK